MTRPSDGYPVSFGPVDEETAAVLDLIAGDPLHARDREVVVRAILASAAEHGGLIDPNDVRARIGNRVWPQITGPTYRALSRADVIKAHGAVTSTDRHGRNSGKLARTYRLAGGGDRDTDGTG